MFSISRKKIWKIKMRFRGGGEPVWEIWKNCMENLENKNFREEVSLYGTPKEEVAPTSSTSRSVGSSNLEPNLGENCQKVKRQAGESFSTFDNFKNVPRSHKYSGISNTLGSQKIKRQLGVRVNVN